MVDGLVDTLSHEVDLDAPAAKALDVILTVGDRLGDTCRSDNSISRLHSAHGAPPAAVNIESNKTGTGSNATAVSLDIGHLGRFTMT